MANIIEATFDGKVLHPDEPLELAPNTRVRIAIEEVLSDEEKPAQEPVSFLDVALSLEFHGPPDWSANLDRYMYGYLHDEADDSNV